MFKVNDRVISAEFGKGTVVMVQFGTNVGIPILVRFDETNENLHGYDLDGKFPRFNADDTVIKLLHTEPRTYSLIEMINELFKDPTLKFKAVKNANGEPIDYNYIVRVTDFLIGNDGSIRCSKEEIDGLWCRVD